MQGRLDPDVVVIDAFIHGCREARAWSKMDLVDTKIVGIDPTGLFSGGAIAGRHGEGNGGF